MASYPPPPPGAPGAPPPPGGYPPPPPGWDPRGQRRYWRDQARAQRAQVRAQAAQWRYQVRAQRRGSILAPVLLITVGVIFLLIQTGHIDRTHFWTWYAQWWPLLLVAAGIVVLLEWGLDQFHMRQPDAPQYRRTFGGGVTLLVFVFIFTGIAAAHATHREDWGWFFRGMNIDQDSMDEMFGDKHESDQMLDVAFPEGSALTVVNPRGNVTINGTSDDGRLHIAEHKQVYAHSDSDAESKAQQLSPDVQGSPQAGAGSHVSITLPSLDGARADLVLTVPSSAETMVTANRGDIRIGSIKGNVTATANRGDVELTGITGETTVHINNGHSSLSAHSIDGGLTITGHAQDLTLAEITGPLNISGDFFGTTHLQHINGAVRFHTSRADIQMARLDGQSEIQRDSDVSADQVMGPVVLNTRNGNVTLERVAGDISVTNRNGAIDLSAAPKLGNITLEDRGGSIRVTLPQDAAFSVEATTSDGNVDSDFQLSSTQSDDHKMFRGTVGNGGPMVRLTARDGDVTLHKGDIQPIPPTPPAPPRFTMTPEGMPAPQMPGTPKMPKMPKFPKTPKPPTPPPPEVQ